MSSVTLARVKPLTERVQTAEGRSLKYTHASTKLQGNQREM